MYATCTYSNSSTKANVGYILDKKTKLNELQVCSPNLHADNREACPLLPHPSARKKKHIWKQKPTPSVEQTARLILHFQSPSHLLLFKTLLVKPWVMTPSGIAHLGEWVQTCDEQVCLGQFLLCCIAWLHHSLGSEHTTWTLDTVHSVMPCNINKHCLKHLCSALRLLDIITAVFLLCIQRFLLSQKISLIMESTDC